MVETRTEDPSETAALQLLWRSFHSVDGRIASCPSCGQLRRFHRVSKRRAYVCDRCGGHVYPAATTPFARSSLPLSSWLSATAMIVDAQTRVKPGRLAHTLGVSYHTAWRMRERIERSLASPDGSGERIRSLAASWRRSGGLPEAGSADVVTPEDRIRAAACRVMAQRGLAATRVADIAREAGVSNATIHYYFRSKDDVLIAAFRWSGEQLHESLTRLRQERVDAVQQVRRLLEMSVPSDQVLHDEYLLWLEVWVRVRSHPDFLQECMHMSNQWYEAVREIFGRGIEEGVFHPAVPLEEVCDRYVALSESLAYRSALGYQGITPRRSQGILARFTAEQLHIAPESVGEQSLHGEPAESLPDRTERSVPVANPPAPTQAGTCLPLPRA